MSAATARIDVRRAILKGMENAYKKYYKLSGETPTDAPEYFIVSQIAESLGKVKPGWVTLESKVSKILKSSGAVAIGRTKNALRKNGKFDAVLWYKNKSPRAIIEVKHPLNVADTVKINKDVERICIALSIGKKYGSTLKMGYFVFCSSARITAGVAPRDARDKIKRGLVQIEKKCTVLAKKHKCKDHLYKSKIRVNAKEAWTVSMFTFHALPNTLGI